MPCFRFCAERRRDPNTDQPWDLISQLLADLDVVPSLSGKPQEHDNGAIQPDHVLT